MKTSRHSTGPEGLFSSCPAGRSEISQNTNSDFCSWESLALASHYRLRELAQICHVSVRTLQRHFHKHYDVTVSQWLHDLRLEQARIQLATAESIKAVAYALGYKRPSHFTRDFKDHFGVPPSIWIDGDKHHHLVVQPVHFETNNSELEMDLFGTQQTLPLKSSRN